MELEFHEISNIFPLEEDDLDELVNDLRRNGQQVAIELLDGKILDGRRRYLGCKRAGLNPRVVEITLDDPVDYVVSLNLHRRHLTPGQKAISAVKASKLKEKYAKEAKERMLAGRGFEGSGGRGHRKNPGAQAPEGLESGRARDHLGKAFGVSGRSTESATKVLARGTPELQAAVNSNLIGISTAEEISILPDEDQNSLVSEIKQAAVEGKKSSLTRKNLREKKREKVLSANGLKGVGIERAHEAINCLKRIPKHDALRDRAFQIVKDWIRLNK